MEIKNVDKIKRSKFPEPKEELTDEQQKIYEETIANIKDFSNSDELLKMDYEKIKKAIEFIETNEHNLCIGSKESLQILKQEIIENNLHEAEVVLKMKGKENMKDSDEKVNVDLLVMWQPRIEDV